MQLDQNRSVEKDKIRLNRECIIEHTIKWPDERTRWVIQRWIFKHVSNRLLKMPKWKEGIRLVRNSSQKKYIDKLFILSLSRKDDGTCLEHTRTNPS